jgi:hypothetical protein
MLTLCSSLAGVWPAAAGAEDFPWQQIYRCAMLSDAISNFATDQGRDGSAFEREWDQLMTAALLAHKKDYLLTRPTASPEELRAAWELDTGSIEQIFEADVDRSPDAVAFLRDGYNKCAPLRTTLLLKP